MKAIAYLLHEPVQSLEAAHPKHVGRAGTARRFLLHFGEMVLAMLAGMALFAGLRAVLSGTGPADNLRDHLDFRLVAMAVFMALPMVAVMRVRGHRWARTAEMAGAMIVPVAVVCLLSHVLTGLSDDTVATSSHVLMYVGMLGVMLYRYREYAHVGPHGAAAHG